MPTHINATRPPMVHTVALSKDEAFDLVQALQLADEWYTDKDRKNNWSEISKRVQKLEAFFLDLAEHEE